MKLYLISALLLIQFNCVGKKEKETSVQPDIIEDLLKATYESGELNGNVLVVSKGKAIYEGSFGFADPEKETPLTPAHRFGFGSIYKEFPAVAIMQLKSAGKLSLDDSVDQYLLGLPAWSADVSIRQLLFYMGGLPNVDWNTFFAKGDVVTEATLWKELSTMEQLRSLPGTNYNYTNYSPFLLIKIIEAITAEPFEEYAKTHLFDPAGMNNINMPSGYPYPPGSSMMAIPFSEEGEADGYALSGISLLYCATAQDLSGWVNALHKGEIIPLEDLQVLAPTANPKDEDQQSPLGNCKMLEHEITEHIHHGSMGNYEALIHRNNEEDLTIVLLTNQKHSNVHEIAEAIQVAVLNH
ncbi:MAG: serine hydrolase domain-containing protein [Lewinella sp.]